MSNENLAIEEENAQEVTQVFPAERQLRITKLLQKHITMRVADLSSFLDVSAMTIRRDLIVLERRGVLQRTHGGAVVKEGYTAYRESAADRKGRSAGRKSRLWSELYQQKIIEVLPSAADKEAQTDQLARKAAELIKPHDTLFLRSGPTSAAILRHLNPEIPARIYTNNLDAIEAAEGKNVELVFLGGEYQYDSHSFEGPLVMESLRGLFPQKIFLTPDGVCPKHGITSNSLWEAALERTLINQSRGEVIILAPSGILEVVADTLVAPIEKSDTLILDQNMPEENLQQFRNLGVKVISAAETTEVDI